MATRVVLAASPDQPPGTTRSTTILDPHRPPRWHRPAALLLAVAVGGALGVGTAQPWHRHLLEGLQLFHAHSHLGGHHHQELHAIAEGTHRSAEPSHRSPGHRREPGEDGPSDSDCTLISGGPTSLERSAATFTAPAFVPQRREVARLAAFRVGELVSRPGARAPPA